MASNSRERDVDTLQAAQIGLRIWRFCCLPLVAGMIAGLIVGGYLWWKQP